jgi:FKBP-type peptidyl-prolyl cis-trans isomerase
MNVTSNGIAVALAVVVVLGFLWFGAFNPFMAPAEPAPAAMGTTTNVISNQPVQRNMITDVAVGTGAEAVNGSTVSVQYTGRFEDGTVFDSSIPRGEPITFVLGQGRVIQGWEQGILGMKVGGKRQLVIPPELGYGPNDYGPIPGNSMLYFDVELVDVQ